MQLTLITPILIALVFGLVVAAVELLIGSGASPFPVRSWLARAFVYMCFCWIILFGVIRV
jgi:hypothetical protein